MRQGGRGAEEDQRISAQMHLRVAGDDQVADLLLRHPFFQICKNRAVDVAGGFAGEAHQLEFVRGFYAAAGDGDGIRRDEIVGGRGGAEMIEEGEGKAFFDADAAGAEAAIGERCGDELRGAFVFLPGADFGGVQERFAHAGFFEGGRDEDGLPGARDDEGQQAFAEPPADAGEIVEGSAGADEEGVEGGIGLGHQGLRAEEAGVEFVGGDGVDAVAERFEGGEGGGSLRWRKRGNESYRGCGCSGVEKVAARDGSHGVRG